MSNICCFCGIEKDNNSYIQIFDMITTSINNNGTIAIKGLNLQRGAVEINTDGNLKFNKSGIYYISWWMNFIYDNTVVSLQKVEDNEVIASSSSPDRRIALKGNSIFEVNAGEEIKFVNDSGGRRGIRSNIPGVSIDIVLIEL